MASHLDCFTYIDETVVKTGENRVLSEPKSVRKST